MTTAAATRRRRRGGLTSSPAAGWLFLAPWLLGFLLITVGPMVASLYFSFTDYSMLDAPEWVGFDNYARMLDDAKYLQSVTVTLRYVLISVPLQLSIALAMALFLNRGLRGLAIYRSVLYLPSMIASSVGVAIMWRQIFGKEGLLNGVLAIVGIDGPSWIAEPAHALSTLIVLNGWTFGGPMVIFLAGLRQIPGVYYEAAAVDGINRWQRFWHITVPLLSPIVFFNFVLQIINAFQAFTPAYIISGGSGGPVGSTLFYTLYLYQQAFTSFNMGYASAMAWVLLLVIAAATALNFWASRYWVFYDD